MSFASINWTLIIAATALAFSIINFWLTQRKELAWKRAEFLFSQSHYLDNDPVLIEMVDILEGRHLTVTIDDIFGTATQLEPAEKLRYQQRFDKLLNLLWNLCYAYLTVKTLKKNEIEGFSWYLWRISEYPILVEYCNENGYKAINQVIERLKPDWDD